MLLRHRIVVNPDFPQADGIINIVTAAGLPADSEVIYRGDRNTLVSINCINGNIDNRLQQYLNVKSFRVPPFPNDIVYRFLRKSKAERSYLNALKLQHLGFLTPQPYGFSEWHQGLFPTQHIGLGLRMTHSYYFCRQLNLPNVRRWEERSDIDRFLPAFAAEIARLHRAGVFFRDFSPGNILVEKTSEVDYRFFYVDLNRMEFDVTDEATLMQMFRSISWHEEWIAKLARDYAIAMVKDEEKTVAMAVAANRAFRAHHEKKQRLKHLFHLTK